MKTIYFWPNGLATASRESRDFYALEHGLPCCFEVSDSCASHLWRRLVSFGIAEIARREALKVPVHDVDAI